MIGLDLMGARAVVGSTATTLTDVFAVAHPIGRGILQFYGAGALADPIEQLQRQGIEATMTPEERAKAQAAKTAAAEKLRAEQQAAIKQQQAAKAPGRTWWIVVGGVIVAVIGGILFFRRKP